MQHIEIYVPFLIAILGVAYPIIIQVISRTEDRYSSNSITVLFSKEPIHNVYFWLLITSIIFIVLWIIDLSPLNNKMIELLFENSTENFVFVFVTLLIVSFFLEMQLLMTYSSILGLSKRLKKNYRRNNTSLSPLYYMALSDLLICAMRVQNNDAIELLTDFIGGEFEEFRKQGN